MSISFACQRQAGDNPPLEDKIFISIFFASPVSIGVYVCLVELFGLGLYRTLFGEVHLRILYLFLCALVFAVCFVIVYVNSERILGKGQGRTLAGSVRRLDEPAATRSEPSLVDGEDREADDPDRACCVCMTNEKRCAVVACGHMAMCIRCSNSLLRNGNRNGVAACPLCRAEGRVVKIFV